MTDFVPVKLELVRPGPAHNQLLSPLTAYMALCGEGSPITFHIDLEHHQMLSRLERLRYVVRQGSVVAGVPDRMREAALLEVGNDVKRVLGDIRSLLAEISRARASHPERDHTGRAVHLRLVLGGSELALIPFEMAFAPQAFPGEGLEFCLQLALPVVPTRETRSSRQLPVDWDRDLNPRVLFVAAAPGELTVPVESHVHALRAAVEPWVRWPIGEPPGSAAMEERRLPLVKQRLRVIVDASIEDIREQCARERFTHVHVLAHGDTYVAAGEQRFGLALCRAGDPSRKDVVSGARLAAALQPSAASAEWRSSPLIVTLATCDAGNQGSLLVPGGSIAHDLHMAGIPWVIASQFPLTVRGSVRLVEALYPLLLRGDDPREVLYEARRRLFMRSEHDHDWAALVAYATVPDDFDNQIYNFFERQTSRAIFVSMGRADDLASRGNRRQWEGEIDRQLRLAQQGLNLWEERLQRWAERLPAASRDQAQMRRVECYGTHGSVYKRMALLRELGQPLDLSVDGLLGKALEYYGRAMDEMTSTKATREVAPTHHWVATQALALEAVLGKPRRLRTLIIAQEMAKRDLERGSVEARAWAYGSLAELEMLALYHWRDDQPGGMAADQQPAAPPDARRRDLATANVVEHCQNLVALSGLNSFPVESTRSQFERYQLVWQNLGWADIAEAAVRALRRQPGDLDASRSA